MEFNTGSAMRANKFRARLRLIFFITIAQFSALAHLVQAQDVDDTLAAQLFGDLEFSYDDNLAYLEAIEFCLEQIGSPIVFDEAAREAMQAQFARAYPGLPLEIQYKLANARVVWTEYHTAWNYLGIDEQKAFAYDVLGLAFGGEAAAEALGYSQSSESESYDDVMDDFCIHNPGVCP